MHHYLLSPYEAELLSIFRGLSDESKALVAQIMSSQYDVTCRNPIERVGICAVK